jgi:1-acyl-sn-glycerol-3-phosphate acyltransferase
MNLYYRAWHYLLRAVAPLLTRISVRGLRNVPRTGPVILVSNHISLADPPILIGYAPRHVHFIIKIELLDNPILGRILPPGEPIPIHRGKADRVALRQAEAYLKDGGAVGIYPEGTRSHSGVAREAHAGVTFLAQRTGARIVPVAISGAERIFSRRFPWYRRARVELTFGPPFTLDDLRVPDKRDREAIAHAVMGRVAMLLPPRYRGVFAPPENPEEAPIEPSGNGAQAEATLPERAGTDQAPVAISGKE